MDLEAEMFITNAPCLLNTHLTPKLRSQVEDAIAAHSNKDNSRTPEDLQRLRQDVAQRWNHSHREMMKYAAIERALEAFAFTMVGILAIDYVSDELLVDELPMAPWVLASGNSQQRARAMKVFDISESDLTNGITTTIPYVIEEFLLDREHANFRLKNVVQGEGSYVKNLYQQGEMKPLADIVAKDKEMLKQFASWSQQCQGMCQALQGLYQAFPELVEVTFPSLYPERSTRTRSNEPTEHKNLFGKVQNLFRKKNARVSNLFAAGKWQ